MRGAQPGGSLVFSQAVYVDARADAQDQLLHGVPDERTTSSAQSVKGRIRRGRGPGVALQKILMLGVHKTTKPSGAKHHWVSPSPYSLGAGPAAS